MLCTWWVKSGKIICGLSTRHTKTWARGEGGGGRAVQTRSWCSIHSDATLNIRYEKEFIYYIIWQRALIFLLYSFSYIYVIIILIMQGWWVSCIIIRNWKFDWIISIDLQQRTLFLFIPCIESQQLFCQYASTVMALCFRILHRSDSESGDCDAAHIKTLERKKFLERISDVAGAELSSDAWVALRCCCAAHSTSPFCHTASTVNYTDLWCTQWAKEHATTERWSGAIAPVVVWPAGHVTRERRGRPAPKYLRSTRSTTPKNLLLLPFLFHFSMLKCYSNGVK